MPNKYVVYAGDERPAFITANHVEKGSGQTRTEQGKKPQLYANRPGDVGFPNMTEVWGVRLDKDGKVPESPLSVTDKDYSGKIKWMDWGKEGGCAIVARWLSGYDTVDYQYQKLVLKADDKISEDSDVWFLILKSGINEFNETTDAQKVELLKVTSYNRDSKSKNPDVVGFMFHEKNEAEEQKADSKKIDAKIDAGLVVRTASKDSSHVALRNLSKAL